MIAAVLLAATLLERVASVDPNHDVTAIEYDRYRSGRPRRVIATIGSFDYEANEVLLLRLPDDDTGKPRVLDRKPLDERPVSLSLQRLIDPKDVVVQLFANHTPGAELYRVRGDRLVWFGEPSVYWGLISADLDHDGVPEIISSGCCWHTQCGVMIWVGIERFNGRKYVEDGHKYLWYRAAAAGTKPLDDEFYVDADPAHATRKFRVRTFTEGRITRSRVTIDDESVGQDGFVMLETDDCHTIHVDVHGDKRALLHVFIERL